MQNIVIKYVVDDSQLNKARESSQRAQKATDDLRNSTNKYGKEAKQAGDSGQKAFNQISTAIKSISFVLVAKELLDFTKQVIAVRGEFQKFEAVLTNTLGSKSAALIALGRINEFAKSTPFGVKELTDNFIKLANRGIQPTVQQMRAIADLSATLGKDFSQVVEAILDINNPERWKEIGIKAETAGNKVKLTFRGVTQEVDRTVEGVTTAVVALGKLNGVAGSTEAISRTLAGQTSNLSDSWEQLLNTIGKGNEGVLFDAVSLLGRAIDRANDLLKSDEQRFEELQSKTLAKEVEAFEKLAIALGDANKAEQLFLEKREDRLETISKRQKELFAFEPTTPEGTMAKERELEFLTDLYTVYDTDLPKAIKESIAALQAKSQGDKVATGIVEALRAKIKELNEEIEKTRSASDLGNNGRLVKQLKETQEQLDRLLGKDTKSDKDAKKKLAEFQKDLEAEAEADQKFRERTAEDKHKRERENEHRSHQLQEYFADLRAQKRLEEEEEEIEILEDMAARRRKTEEEISNLTFDILSSQITSLFEMEVDGYTHRINALRDFYDEQIALAGDNERAKKEIRIREDREVRELEKQKADREKKAAQAGIIVNTALSVIKIFAGEGTYVDKIIRAAIMAAEGASQYAVASRARYYAKGEINIKGGTPGRDSIPAVLMPGESIMTTKETKEAFGILTDVRAGRLNDKIIRQMVSNGGSQQFDDSRIVSAIKGQPRPPDVLKIGRNAYEVYKDQEGNKRFIRSKAI